MNNEENTQGNPETPEDSVFGSEGNDFFDNLENDVNSIVQDDTQPETSQKETSQTENPSNQNVPDESGVANSDVDSLKKRYSDSSREAQKLRAQLNELKPFVPVLDAMKNDSGLVSHVRDYFNNGGNVPKNLKEELKLDEDFEFDPDEMVNNTDSDSRKVFDRMVDKVVQQRIGESIEHQNQQRQAEDQKGRINSQAVDFMRKRGMSEDEFSRFVQAAQNKFQTSGMTFDDMYLIMNQGQVNQNVANATKKDMLNQMKNVRNIPTSQGASNNAGKPNSQLDNVFDALLNSDGNIEELLG